MHPFSTPTPVIAAVKDKIESLATHDDRLYLGTATGSVYIYASDSSGSYILVDTKKSLVRRSIDQLGFIKDVNSLVVLSDMSVTLFPLPSLSPPSPLQKARAAFSFGVWSYTSSSPPSLADPNPIPTLITILLVGCRRKAVVYTWKDGELGPVRESPLPHSPRTIVFIDEHTACFAYSASEHALFSLDTLSVTDINTPLPGSITSAHVRTDSSASTTGGAGPVATTATMGMAALTGLGNLNLAGWGLAGGAAKSRPGVIRVDGVAAGGDPQPQALISKDGEGYFVTPDGQVSRSASVIWSAGGGSPDEIAFMKPYIVASFPAGSMLQHQPSTEQPLSPNTTSVLQIRSVLSPDVAARTAQCLVWPFADAPTTSDATIRFLTPSSSQAQTHSLFLLTTPTDRTLATSAGSTLWRADMRPWTVQLDELVREGRYAEALGVLGMLGEKDKHTAHTIRALNAVSLFAAGQYDAAIDTFVDLEVSPAKVVALYPESVSGRLGVKRAGWVRLFGGPTDGGGGSEDGERDDTASIGGRSRTTTTDTNRPIESLLRYLADRRPKLRAALESAHIIPDTQDAVASPLSTVSVDELYALPDAPLAGGSGAGMTPEQLLRCAQVVDTALYKCYLIVRPALLGSLCRLENWCEVSEVEEDLRARKKYAELKDLYHGRKMHAKALKLLKELSTVEEDNEEKLWPTIRYLQKLGPENIDLVFEHSRWMFDVDEDMAFQVFTSEDVDLPRKPVCDFLERIDMRLAVKYLEYVIEEKESRQDQADAETEGEEQEQDQGSQREITITQEERDLHDRLAELYLRLISNSQTAREVYYDKLLRFISTDGRFRVDRLFALVSSSDLHEARALLLGKLGRHDHALETYVYKMRDYVKAEEYCRRVYQYQPHHQPQSHSQPHSSSGGTPNVFLTLLRIYLRPTDSPSQGKQGTHLLLEPALALISRHSARLDAVETLQMLPPLVTMRGVRSFLFGALSAPQAGMEMEMGSETKSKSKSKIEKHDRTTVFDARVVRMISKARNDQAAVRLAALQSRRVKVVDGRICPQCHKRLGNSVIAVHAPRGEVTHYQCREPFSRTLKT